MHCPAVPVELHSAEGEEGEERGEHEGTTLVKRHPQQSGNVKKSAFSVRISN